MEHKPSWAIVVLMLIIGLGIGYWYGAHEGYKRGDVVGYERAQVEAKKLQDETAAAAAAAIAKAANPFETTNPLEGVSANPFDTVKNILNPFK